MDREIELVWKRAVFLTAFLIAAFAGYGGLIATYLGAKEHHTGDFAIVSIAALGIAFVGMALSVIWIMMAKGSKAWQEHYEKVIECFVKNHEKGECHRYSSGDYRALLATELENEEPPIEKKEERGETYPLEIKDLSNRLDNASGGCYSVSKLVIKLGQFFFLIWATILGCHLVYLVRHWQSFVDAICHFVGVSSKSCGIGVLVSVISILIGVAVVALIYCTIAPGGVKSEYLDCLLLARIRENTKMRNSSNTLVRGAKMFAKMLIVSFLLTSLTCPARAETTSVSNIENTVPVANISPSLSGIHLADIASGRHAESEREIETKVERRIKELESEQHWFMGCVAAIMTAIGFLVSLIGIGVPLVTSQQMRKNDDAATKKVDSAIDDFKRSTDSFLNDRQGDRAEIRKEIDYIKAESHATVLQLRAENCFQLARIGYEQFKISPKFEILKSITLNLSYCIKFNIQLSDAERLKSCCAFVYQVLVKDPDSPEVEQLREKVFSDLKTWSWGFSEADVRRILERSSIDSDHVAKSVETIRIILSRTSRN